MSRYKVVPESQSAHCCFEATVVDTTRPNPNYPGMFMSVCECFDEADAQRICDALNSADHPLMRPLAGELVPPTKAMLRAGVEAGADSQDQAGDVYEAMIKAHQEVMRG